ncbi:hypothetical protein C7974DRAFT_473606 [Boeremia exigua]|uniref:uncharacterized protein n=1 Tax=Boeremia exigua TaxID=749465 RepID=UPI001E8D3409|nr:uncharacterized protein C7974DRAFT_473606 [Boeremia exigua]KAH6622266.1 hypothetical protein C7974DRAFT_473606 [Boeremia exigua]
MQQYRVTNENEEKWVSILRRHIFQDYPKIDGESNTYEKKLKGWEIHADVLWNEFPCRNSANSKHIQITQPKPDVTYGFPIIQPSDDVYRTLSGDPNVDSFSLPVLGELRSRADLQLMSTPTTALARWASNRSKNVLQAKDLMCFPWAIVEMKRGTPEPLANNPPINKREARDHEKRTEFCYCQAANASAAGLILRERLAEKANAISGAEAAQVMLAFTCVGSTAKLWITYRKKLSSHNDNSYVWPDKKGCIMMHCIWTTSLELSWGVMALRVVVKNVKDWVYTHIEPNIARWIAQIRSAGLQTYSLTPGGDIIGFRRRAASLGPTQEDSDSEELEVVNSRSQHCTPQGKLRPHLQHGQTAPESLDRRLIKVRIPQIRLNGLTKIDHEDSDDGPEIGHKSARLSGARRKLKVDSNDLSAFIYDEGASEDDADETYSPSKSEDDSGQSNSEEEDSVECASADDGNISDEEVKELLDTAHSYLSSDSQRYCFQLPDRSQPISWLEACSTSSELVGTKTKKDRRGSARF